MISPDLAETVKRLRELLPKITPEWGLLDPTDDMRVRTPNGWVVAHVVYAHRGDKDDKAMSVANAAFIATANRKAISSILDALEGLERDNADTHARERALIGERDAAYRGRMEWFERATKAESSLAEARKGARIVGCVEVCGVCHIQVDEPGFDCGDSGCPIKRAQHPTAPQETPDV